MNLTRIWKCLAALAVGASLTTFVASGNASAQASSGKPAAHVVSSASEPIDINSASEADFERLPGIGPSRAKAIVELREQIKGFHRVEDLMRVKGIGRKTFQKLSTLVTLGNVPASKADASGKGSAKP